MRTSLRVLAGSKTKRGTARGASTSAKNAVHKMFFVVIESAKAI